MCSINPVPLGCLSSSTRRRGALHPPSRCLLTLHAGDWSAAMRPLSVQRLSSKATSRRRTDSDHEIPQKNKALKWRIQVTNWALSSLSYLSPSIQISECSLLVNPSGSSRLIIKLLADIVTSLWRDVVSSLYLWSGNDFVPSMKSSECELTDGEKTAVEKSASFLTLILQSNLETLQTGDSCSLQFPWTLYITPRHWWILYHFRRRWSF